MTFYSPYILAFFSIAFFLGSVFFGNQPIAFAATSVTINATTKIPVCGNGVKETNEQCDGSDFGGRSCSYLGFSGGTPSCNAGCGYNTSSCTSAAEEIATPLFSANIGGSYTITDGNNSAKIRLLPYFYFDDVRLQMFAFNKSSRQSFAPLPAGKNLIGKIYKFLFVNSNGNITSTISKLATITLTYTNLDVNNSSTNTFAPYRRGSGGTWSLIPGYILNTMNKTITFSTGSFGAFAIFASSPLPSPPPSGGGGGGGGGSIATIPQTASVTLSGRAYPGSAVTILKDAVVAAKTRVGEDAIFSITVGSLQSGAYLFSVYATDSNGNRSSTVTIPVSVTAGVNANASGIFLAPTISVDKTEVKWGDPIRVFGRTAPKNTVTISVHSNKELFFQTPSDKNGVYSYSFLTMPLTFGEHTVNVGASGNGEVSRMSSSLAFTVGTKNVKNTIHPVNTSSHNDLNDDGKVNIVDFSIEAFWYKKPNPPVAYDLNGDGIINIVDFSIMASNWTG